MYFKSIETKKLHKFSLGSQPRLLWQRLKQVSEMENNDHDSEQQSTHKNSSEMSNVNTTESMTTAAKDELAQGMSHDWTNQVAKERQMQVEHVQKRRSIGETRAGADAIHQFEVEPVQ